MNIEHSCTPADIDFLTQKINQETPDFGSAHPFAFFVRDEKNQIIAGCNGSVIFGSIYMRLGSPIRNSLSTGKASPVWFFLPNYCLSISH